MKVLFVFFLVFFTCGSFAGEMVFVEDVGGGACLVQEKPDEMIARVASFNDGVTWNLDSFTMKEIREDLSKKLAEVNVEFNDEEMELFFHCGGYGASLVMNIDMEDFRICVWGEFLKNNSLRVRSIGATRQGGTCNGSIPGQLMIYTTSLEATDKVVEQLKGDKWKNMITHVRKRSEGSILIYLEDQYLFSEKKVILEIGESFSKDMIRFVEPEFFYHPIGEYKNINISF